MAEENREINIPMRIKYFKTVSNYIVQSKPSNLVMNALGATHDLFYCLSDKPKLLLRKSCAAYKTSTKSKSINKYKSSFKYDNA